jgi:hypothetical protein
MKKNRGYKSPGLNPRLLIEQKGIGKSGNNQLKDKHDYAS